MVGDVINIAAGTRVPADCLIVESADLEIEESKAEMSAGQESPRRIHKAAVKEGEDGEADPFLFANSLVTRGKCKALVCRVGPLSSRGSHEEKLETDVDTALQRKLVNLASHFRRLSCYAAGAIFLLMTVLLIIHVSTFDKEARAAAGLPGTASVVISRLASQVNFAVVLLVVSIPEGLPLAIGVSLAFSVAKMYSDKLLVRQLDAPEKMGAVQEICCGKTGTITKGDMRVAQFHCESQQIKNTRKNTFFNCELSADTLDRVQESILYNCDAHIEMDATTYVPVGNPTEVAFLRFLQDADVPVHMNILKKLDKTRASLPFAPATKRSASAVLHPEDPNMVMVYVKGAPETILEMCDRQMDREGFSEVDKDSIQSEVSKMAGSPLRVIAFAYAQMDLDQWEQGYEGQSNTPERILEDALQNNQLPLTFIGAFGLQDSLRPKVPSCVKHARESARIAIRLISGDHIETARKCAKKAGILKPEEAGREYAVMHANDFRSMVGGLQSMTNSDGQIELSVANPEVFEEIAKSLRVLARATAEDKFLLIQGLKNLGRRIAVTGDGINDVDALKCADVGLAMGSGCSAARESSSMILVGDDFEAAIRAVMWGRNIYHNITRFIQFQMTVNVSALATVFVGIILFN